MYKSAIKFFKFSEVNGINLGFSESGHGAVFGEKLRKQVIGDAFDIVKFTKRIQDELGESYWIGKNVQISLFNIEEKFLLSRRLWCFPACFLMGI